MDTYGKVLHFNDRQLDGLLDEPCYIQEKIDGGQFSFGIDPLGKLLVRSRNVFLDLEHPDSLYSNAVKTVKFLYESNKLQPLWAYRGEAINSPRHNKLNYKEVPPGNIVLFDIFDVSSGRELTPAIVEESAKSLNLLYAPILRIFNKPKEELTADFLKDLVAKTTSCINNTVPIEGVVIKRYGSVFKRRDGCIGRAKYVSDDFKEIQRTKKKLPNDKFSELANIFATEARKYKVVQKLKESGEYTGTMKDMGKIVPILIEDVEEECMDLLKNMVYAAVRKSVGRGLTDGLSSWYQEKLMNKEFE